MAVSLCRALGKAVEDGRSSDEIVKILEKGGNPNPASNKDFIPMHWAAGKGNIAALERLVALKADVNFKNSCGEIALHEAAEKNQWGAIRYLVSVGAKVNALDNTGETPLMSAARKGKKKSITVLLALKADPLIRSKYGYTARSLTIFIGHLSCASALVKDAYSEEFLNRKVIGHFCGVKGSSSISTTKFTLEFGYSHFMHRKVFEMLKVFFEKPFGYFTEIQQKTLITAFFPGSRQRSNTSFVKSIVAQKLTIVIAGWHCHALDLVFIDSYLAICNRGEGIPMGCSTIEVFKINPKLVTETIMAKIQKQNDLTKEHAAAFFYKELPKMLLPDGKTETVQDDICKLFKQGAPKVSKHDTCTLNCSKAAFQFAASMLKILKLDPEKHLSQIMVVRRVRKHFFSFARVGVTHAYVKELQLKSLHIRKKEADCDLVDKSIKKITARFKKHTPSSSSRILTKFQDLKKDWEAFNKSP